MGSSTLAAFGSQILSRLSSVSRGTPQPIAVVQDVASIPPAATASDTFVDPVVGSGEDGIQNPVVRTVSSGSSKSDVSSVPLPSGTTPHRVPLDRKKKSPRPPIGALSVELSNTSKKAQALLGGGYDVGPALHTLFSCGKDLLMQVCQQLAYPYADVEREKKVTAVVGLGAYGGFLAEGIASFLSSGAGSPVAYLPIEQCTGTGWHFASDEMVSEELRAKYVLVVLPALTPSTLKHLEECLRLIEGAKKNGGLGSNVTVLGVATPYIFNCSHEIRRTGKKPLSVTWLQATHGIVDEVPKE